MARLVQEYLKTHTLAEIQAPPLNIKVSRSIRFPELVLFNYNMISSPLGDPMVQQCRGLILNENDGWSVVAYPYDKFFNHGEGHAAQIDWSTARVMEKLDGTLCTLYWYGGQWNVATRGRPDASGPVNSGVGTFEELFWNTWKALGYEVPEAWTQEYVFMFELCTKNNQVVVRHPEPRLVLHGVNQGGS